MSTAIRDLRDQLTQELGRVVIGVEASVEALVIALIARGHVHVQGVPGLGKTLFAKALARARRGVQAHPGNRRPDAERHHRGARVR